MTLLACIGYARWIIPLAYDDGEKAKMGFTSNQIFFFYGMAFVRAGVSSGLQHDTLSFLGY